MRLERAVPDLTVDDVQAAVRTYTKLLGLTVLMDHGWIVTLGTPGSPAQFSVMHQDLTAPVNPALSLEVDDVDSAYAEARAQGLEIVHDLVDEAWGVRRFFFRDEDGTVVNVLAHADRPCEPKPSTPRSFRRRLKLISMLCEWNVTHPLCRGIRVHAFRRDVTEERIKPLRSSRTDRA